MAAEPTLSEHYLELIEHETERARTELARLIRDDPTSVEARSLFAMACQRSMDFAACVVANRAVLELDPKHYGALHSIGLSLLALDDMEGALAAYQQAFAVTSSTISACMSAQILYRLGRLDEAAKGFDRVLMKAKLDSNELVYCQRGMVSLLRDRGRLLAADRYAHGLIERFRRQSVHVSSLIVDRDQSLGFHEWVQLAKKSHLAEFLRRSLEADPGGARVPQSFELPERREALLAYAAGQPAGALYIVKPVRGSGGQGISVVDDVSAHALRSDVVVQRYIDRPYLVDGRKGHFRIYAFITSPEPLRAYIYSEGIARFAPEPYDPRPERLSEVAMHVTNTALHLGHPGLNVSQDAGRDDVGSIWSVSAVLKRMQADGLSSEAVFGEIKDLVTWFLGRVRDEGLFARQAARGPLRSFGPKLIGFDILVDADGHPWLIEIQTKPAAKGAPLVERINSALFDSCFRMTMGLTARDDVGPEAMAAMLADPAAIVRREREIERANLGRFIPLDL